MMLLRAYHAGVLNFDFSFTHNAVLPPPPFLVGLEDRIYFTEVIIIQASLEIRKSIRHSGDQ